MFVQDHVAEELACSQAGWPGNDHRVVTSGIGAGRLSNGREKVLWTVAPRCKQTEPYPAVCLQVIKMVRFAFRVFYHN